MDPPSPNYFGLYIYTGLRVGLRWVPPDFAEIVVKPDEAEHVAPNKMFGAKYFSEVWWRWAELNRRPLSTPHKPLHA